MSLDSSSGDVSGKPRSIVIQTFATRDAADLAVSQLEANGIACWIMADDGGGLYPNLALAQGVRVFVAESDAEAARELLNLPPAPSETGSAEGSSSVTPASQKNFWIGPMVAGILLGIIGTLMCVHVNNPRPVTHYHYTDDGKIDEQYIYVDGHLREHLRDRNLDGKFDVWSYYDSHGLQRSEADNNFDGKPDETWYYSNGVPVAMEKDTDFNGVPDEFGTYKDGLLVQLDIRPNGSKFTTIREFYVNGVVSETWRGGDSNGNFKEIIKYNAFYEPISTNSDSFKLLSSPTH